MAEGGLDGPWTVFFVHGSMATMQQFEGQIAGLLLMLCCIVYVSVGIIYYMLYMNYVYVCVCVCV